eukprot:CAMPEP_0197666894 /NCGR_PEP_ID=MMETSP1338-20131121/64371_1 /TAXON_ID=43686 ORGANISM="Pelagodinium beii, Strain RCC1491" /NCGR_SAMPLE_ID=MMETSP1338 /ASSEMBLY_ACC=CAM_ASM_000754 /LENGTH=145 /DNA_ID=CAMNT_0043246017 /DNA_START=1 /DNA_END=434 /DNA_ORIENTATION=+
MKVSFLLLLAVQASKLSTEESLSRSIEDIFSDKDTGSDETAKVDDTKSGGAEDGAIADFMSALDDIKPVHADAKPKIEMKPMKSDADPFAELEQESPKGLSGKMGKSPGKSLDPFKELAKKDLAPAKKQASSMLEDHFADDLAPT